MSTVTVDKQIYDLPQIKRSMERLDRRNLNDSRYVESLWLRIPWEPGQEPITFSSEEAIVGCVEIYNPFDGKLFGGAN